MQVTIETVQKYQPGDTVYCRDGLEARVISAKWDTDFPPEFIGWHYNVEFVKPKYKGYKCDYLGQNDLSSTPP